MAEPLRRTFARWCRDTRADLDITQAELAVGVGVSRSLIAAYETGRVAPSLDMVDRIGVVLGVEFGLAARRPIILGLSHERDLVHARCSGYADRRFTTAGLLTAREIEVADGRRHGWIDLLAFDPRSRRLIIVEVKTSIHDIGAIERQVGWYERLVAGPARDLGWRPLLVSTWLLLLASEEVDTAVMRQRDVLDVSFPARAADMRGVLGGGMGDGGPARIPARGLALIDPARRRRDWLLPTRVDGRRTAAPYRDRADAARRLIGGAAV